MLHGHYGLQVLPSPCGEKAFEQQLVPDNILLAVSGKGRDNAVPAPTVPVAGRRTDRVKNWLDEIENDEIIPQDDEVSTGLRTL
jgi:hypothetical protein